MKKRLNILDIWVDPVNREEALNRVRVFLSGKKPCSIFAANPEKNFSVQKDSVLYDVFKSADLLIPDGIGIVIAAKILYGAKLSRMPGVELMSDICRLAANEDKSIFIYGSHEAINKAAVKKLRLQHPGLRVAGRSHGYVLENKMPDLIKDINDSGADILFGTWVTQDKKNGMLNMPIN